MALAPAALAAGPDKSDVALVLDFSASILKDAATRNRFGAALERIAARVDETSTDLVAGDTTKQAKALVEGWGEQAPLVVIALHEEENLRKSFRNLQRVAIIGPSEIEVAAIVWARSLLVTEAALPLVQGKAQ